MTPTAPPSDEPGDVLTAPSHAPLPANSTAIAPETQHVLASGGDDDVAAREREEAWRNRQDWSLQGKRLHPWTMEREMFCARLEDLDLPAQSLDSIAWYERRLSRARALAEAEGRLQELEGITLSTLLPAMAILPTAAKVLFIASHLPEELDGYRGRDRAGACLRAVESWAAQAIPEHDPWPAILLARDIRAQHHAVVAMRRPVVNGGRQLGN